MILDEAKKKKEQIKDSIQLLKDVLDIVEKTIDFGNIHKPYKSYYRTAEKKFYSEHIPNKIKVYGEFESRFLHPKIRRLEAEELEEMEFDLEIDKEEEN